MFFHNFFLSYNITSPFCLSTAFGLRGEHKEKEILHQIGVFCFHGKLRDKCLSFFFLYDSMFCLVLNDWEHLFVAGHCKFQKGVVYSLPAFTRNNLLVNRHSIRCKEVLKYYLLNKLKVYTTPSRHTYHSNVFCVKKHANISTVLQSMSLSGLLAVLWIKSCIVKKSFQVCAQRPNMNCKSLCCGLYFTT